MSDTPRTDAQGYGDGRHPYVPTEFARELERELDESRVIASKYEDRYFDTREQRDRLAEALQDFGCERDEVMAERDRLQRELAELREQRDRLAGAIRKHRDELELTSGDSVDRILWNVLDAVKGGSDDH